MILEASLASSKELQSSKESGIMDPQEVHISSLVVHAKPEYLATVKHYIEQLPGAEIHGESDKGKLVVVLETRNQGYITDVIEKIGDLEHVLNIALVYHHIEHLDSLENEIL
jgi:nitrate reductase NapD